MTPSLQIFQGDSFHLLRTLPAESVQCGVTSPPYWGLRDYGIPGTDWPEYPKFYPFPGLPSMEIPSWHGPLGLEPCPFMFTAHLVAVFAELHRVLKPDGTLWVNLGDSYASSGGAGIQGTRGQRSNRRHTQATLDLAAPRYNFELGLKPKDLIGIPWRVAFAMQAAGWYHRQDIVWHKPNPMPESVSDRCTKAHEQIFLFTKSASYFYNTEAAREPVTGTANARGTGANPKAKLKTPDGWDTSKQNGRHGTYHKQGREKGRSKQNESFSTAVKDTVTDRNWRSVWTIPSEAYPDAHFATYPTTLPRRCILAGTRPGDTFLDPFGGSGTTGQVALELGRSAILLEINPAYITLAHQRTHVTPGLPIS